jgi:hypothetical protein
MFELVIIKGRMSRRGWGLFHSLDDFFFKNVLGTCCIKREEEILDTREG